MSNYIATAIHIYPGEDLVAHETEGAECPCGPRVECDGELVIHNSWDEREKREKYEAHVEALRETLTGTVH